MICKEYPSIGEKCFSGKLPNGLSVFVIPKPGFSKYYAYFAADYGAIDRRFTFGGRQYDTPAGVAHFLEHEMFDMEYGDATVKLSAYGASSNAYTSDDITAYLFECVDNFSQNLETLLEFVSTPYFSGDSVKKEQGIISQEILMYEDEPDNWTFYNLMKILYEHNPIREPVVGSIESIMRITPQILHDCHRAFYNPSNMALCVVGDIDFDEVYDIALRVLPKDASAASPTPRGCGAPETLLPLSARVSRSMDVSRPIFLAGCKSTPASKGKDTLRLDLIGALALDTLLGHSSPLYLRLYGEGLVSEDFSAAFNFSEGAAYTLFGGETDDPDRVFAEVNDEIRRRSADGLDKALFGRIKKAAVGSQIRALNSFEEIAASVAGGYFLGYDAFDAAEVLEQITLDDANLFIRERLIPENTAISTVTPKEA